MNMKKVWIYILTVVGLLLAYNVVIVAGNPEDTTVYPFIVWWLSAMMVYTVIIFIASLVLTFCVKDRRTIGLLIVLSGFLFFIISVVVNYNLLFFRENRILGWNLMCSFIMALESIGGQFLLVGVMSMCYSKWKKRKCEKYNK